MRIGLALFYLILFFPVFADGQNPFIYRKGALFTEILAFRMEKPLTFDNKQTAGIWTEQHVPAQQHTLSYQVILPEYTEGLFFSRDDRPGDHSWPNNTNRLLPWTFRNLADLVSESYPGIPSNGRILLQGDAALLRLGNGDYLFLKAVAGDNSLSWLQVDSAGKLQLLVSTLGEDYLEKHVPVVLYACDSSLYTVMRKAYGKLMAGGEKAGLRKREEKEIPEPFAYLGWCTWEHYHKNIDEMRLLADLRDIEHSDIPVRYVLIDDGHVRNKQDQLSSFLPDSVNFPGGWAPLLNVRRPEKIRWMGLWYGFPGYWQGISADNDFPDRIKACLYPYGGSMLAGKSRKRIDTFYRYYLESLRDFGFDFLKIDIQSFVLPLYMGGTEVIRQAKACNIALEKETHRLGLGLINCMAQNVLNMDHTCYSAVSRVSIDYKKFDEDMARSHLFQSYTNTLLQGQSVWPDHDMFHSSDSICGGMMARSKAVSGGPVYLSDAPRDFVSGLISPLVDREGLLFRPEAPAVPAPESVCSDPFWSGKAYRVVAPVGENTMAMICYNLNKKAEHRQVKTGLRAEDYLYREGMTGKKRKLPEHLILYDWEKQTAEILKGEKIITLDGFTDRLFYFCPLVNGWGVIGLQEKYLSPATVRIVKCTTKTLTLEVLEAGRLKVWQDNHLRTVSVARPGRITLTK